MDPVIYIEIEQRHEFKIIGSKWLPSSNFATKNGTYDSFAEV